MGIFKAAGGALGGVMADQWLEMYCCPAMGDDVLATAGYKQTSERSSNTKGELNVISDGSKIVVNEGQCAIVLEMGKAIAVLSEPGENTFHSEKTGSIFSKGGLKSIAKQTFERVGYGGDAGVYQHVIYIDLRERFNNPFSSVFPVHMKDRNTEYDTDANVQISGLFSFKITNPVVFYKNICGNTTGTVYISGILPQLVTEFNSAAAVALEKLCESGISPSDLPDKIEELCEAVKGEMTEKWVSLRGFSVTSVAIDSLNVVREDLSRFQDVQQAKMLTNPTMAAATLVGAQAKALETAAANLGGAGGVPAGAAGAFVGMGLASQSNNMFLNNNDVAKPALWHCECGTFNTDNFCKNCGKPKTT